MSVFDTPNADGYHGLAEEASAGPRLGFQDAMVAAWNVQTKVNSLFAIEKAFSDAEQAQRTKMEAAGLRPHKSLLDDDPGFTPEGRITNPYMDAARAIMDTGSTDVDGQGGGRASDRIRERDAEIMRERDAHPELGLKTYGEMFDEIRQSAQEAKKRDDLSKTIGGYIGAFVGGAAGGFNPTTDPLNVVTAPLAFGRTIAARVAAQAGIQGGVEGLNVVLNPDTNRLLTGQDLTAGEIATRVGGAAIGGAIVQGIGEAAVIGGRRLLTGKWFEDAPLPKPPEPKPVAEPPIGDIPPRVSRDAPLTDHPTWESFVETHGEAMKIERLYGLSREAKARETADVDYISQQLGRWDGPHPNDIPARTFSAAIPDVEPGVRYSKPYTNYIDRMETVDDIARRLDPDLFRQYDNLAAQRAALSQSIEAEAARFREMRDPDTMLETNAAAHRVQDVARRQELQQIDYKMRDMAPLVSRVYGSAEHEWRHTPVDFATLDFLKQLENRTGWTYRGEGKPSLTEVPLKVDAPKAPASAQINDKVPLARLSPELEAKIGPNSDAVDRVRANVADNMTVMDEKVAQFVSAVKEKTKLDPVQLKTAHEAALEKIKTARDKYAAVVTALPERPSFTSWFAGSQAVDAAGAPLRVYHGTINVFDDFSMRMAGDATGAPSAGEGLFFASNPKVASSYAVPVNAYQTGEGAVGAFVRLVDKLTAGYYAKFNDKIMTLFGGEPLSHLGAPNVRPAYVQMRNPKVVDQAGKEFREQSYFDAIRQAKAEGRDGVIFKNTFDDGFQAIEHGGKTDVYVVFKEEQTRPFSDRFDDGAVDKIERELADAQKELDELEHVTFPDGSKLHLDNDHVVGADGKEISVRDFLREMDKDQQALQSVMTCSRPS